MLLPFDGPCSDVSCATISSLEDCAAAADELRLDRSGAQGGSMSATQGQYATFRAGCLFDEAGKVVYLNTHPTPGDVNPITSVCDCSIAAETPVMDQLCRPCHSGEFSGARNSACRSHTPACDSTTQYQTAAPSASTDRSCSELTVRYTNACIANYTATTCTYYIERCTAGVLAWPQLR